ncbi:glycosyltransferase family 9 protein [Terriglobus albidus]|uniref:glycosyltransferase family 9 protein n=1 Tax=Terriglobus albidus TaxID=1592106 RepID=UPI001FE61E09|nr:glycosyltransferase family 9 protein [Terriglobus albidus]
MTSDLHRKPGSAPRILVVRTGAMGDILHGMPAITALRQAFPQAEIGWVVEPHWAPLLETSVTAKPRSAERPLVDQVHFAETRAWSKHPASLTTLQSILQLRRELRARRYEIAIDLQGSIRSAIIAKLSGAKQIVGPAEPREKQASWMYGTKVATRAEHVIEQGSEIASALVDVPMLPAEVSLPLDPDAERWAETQIVIQAKGRTVLLAPSAGWGAKQWPAERYGELALRLGRNGYSVLVNAVHEQDPLAAIVVRASEGTAKPVIASIAQLIALTRRMRLVVAGDTGPLHLAAALHVPVVAIFGPTDPARNGPYGTRSRVLRDAISVRDHRRHAAPEAGLLRISVDQVETAALELLENNA